MDILCSDKTGTLTKNELTVGDVLAIDQSIDEVLFTAALASNLNGDDPIDKAIFSKVKNLDDAKKYKIEKSIPFDPIRKRTEVTLTSPDGKKLSVAKGAPQNGSRNGKTR